MSKTIPTDVRGSVARHVHIPSVSFEGKTELHVHVLLWQARGESAVTVCDEAYALSAGHALWVPVGSRHSVTTQPGSVVLPLMFDAATTATTLREPTLIPVDRDLRTLCLAFMQARFELLRPDINLTRQILALIEQIPVRVTSLPMPTTAAAWTVAEALRFNPGDDRSVDELAKSAHASVSKIERAFLAEVGMTLRQWRIRNRMEAAAILLRSHTSLDGTARRVGYTTTNSFRRVFKTHFTMTPSEYIARYAVQR